MLPILWLLMVLAAGASGRNSSLPRDVAAYLAQFPGDSILKSDKEAMPVARARLLRKDWCRTEPLLQKVREDGCVTKTMLNRFCYGQCNSFYIPKVHRFRRKEAPPTTDVAFESCAFCQPRKASWVTITLHCPGRQPPLRRKRLQRVKQCKCMAARLQT